MNNRIIYGVKNEIIGTDRTVQPRHLSEQINVIYKHCAICGKGINGKELFEANLHKSRKFRYVSKGKDRVLVCLKHNVSII